MKKKLLLSFPFLLVLLFSSFDQIKNEEGPTELLGSWEYVAPTFGFNYQKGTLQFTYANSALYGTVIFQNKTIPIRKLVYEENKVRGYIMYEGRQVDIFLRFEEDNTFKGTVSHSQGYVRIIGNKIVD